MTATLQLIASCFLAGGCWQNVGDMHEARTQHSATLLRDGRVLMAGGTGPAGVALASAELFEPTTSTFTATGSMAAARSRHGAVLLDDGRVLVMGAHPELFDPVTGTFALTEGDLNVARTNCSATRLPSGQVLIVGGTNDAHQQLDTAELFDPMTGQFTLLDARTTVTRTGHGAVALNDGNVLIYGGIHPGSCCGGGRNEAELFVPADLTFQATGATMAPRNTGVSMLLPDGRVLVTGGDIGGGAMEFTPITTAELFAEGVPPAVTEFRLTGSPVTPRSHHTTARLRDGQVLLAGGIAQGGTVLASAERYSPSAGTMTSVASMSFPRWGHTATTLKDGRVLVAGGRSTMSGSPLASAEAF